MRALIAALTLLAACATSHGTRKTDLDRVHEFWRKLVPTSEYDTTRVGCICQGGALDGRIGTLLFVPYTGIGGIVSCYTLEFDVYGTLRGGTPCDDTYVVLRK